MKKIVTAFAIFFFIVSNATAFAQMPVSMPGTVAPSGLERIGVVAAAQGGIELKMPGQVGRIAQSGQPIFMGDWVNTDAKGHLQILLLDETVFTIGPSSSITIDKFVYDPKSHTGEIRASISKGLFRYVSGKIAVKNPNNVTIKLPTATLGFRGTIVGGSVAANGQGLVGLLGPGENNDAGARTGSFTIEGQSGDQEDVDRTGFGVEVGADGGISNVFQLSEDQVNNLTGGLGGGEGGGEDDGEGGDEGGAGEGGGSALGGDTDMGDLSGETGVITGDIVGFTEGLSGLTDGLNDLTTTVAQDRDTTGATSTTSNITTLAELASIKLGSYAYSVVGGSFIQSLQNGSTVNHIGTFSASWEADFSSQKVSNISVTINTTPGSGNISVADVSLTDVLFSSGSNNQAVFNTSGDNGNITATITLKNSDGIIAHTGEIALSYDNTGGSVPDDIGTGSGSATAVPMVV